jgi:cytochrome c peroxidase
MSGRRPRRAPRWARRGAAVAAVALAAAAVVHGAPRSPAAAAPRADATAAWRWSLPSGFPVPRVPAGNPMSAAKVSLGRWLFHDVRLSGNGTQSCGSCHLQSRAFTDGRATSPGSTGQSTARNAQGLANVAYSPTLTWANPSLVTLERQMETPLFGTDPVEMGVNDRNMRTVLARLRRDARYRTLFRRAYPGQASPIAWGNIIRSIAAFQRTIVSGNSRYDRYLQGRAELTASETRGKDLFFGERAECHHCHGGFNLTDQTTYRGAPREPALFHNTGLYNIGGTGGFPVPNRGVFELTGRAADMGRFRAPSLRNVAVTAPYMHDGSVATLAEVVAIYAAGGRVVADGPYAGDGRANPHRDPLIAAIDLSAQDQADLVAFLNTLTDRSLLTNRRLSDPFASR